MYFAFQTGLIFMKRFILLILFLSFVPFSISAQDRDVDGEVLIKKCSTSEMELNLLKEHPELAPLIRQSEATQEAFRKDFLKTHTQKDGESETYLIPVVFHVIHNYGAANITSAQIHDAIRVMNEDFSAQNSSVIQVNPAFSDIVANTGIQFALAQRDPQGNCTNGIIRAASPITNAGGENLKSLSPSWDRSMYLNIWVCNQIASGSAGYSRYPSSVDGPWGEGTDGIVVRSDYVGSIGTSSLNRSHTLTHEAGHWLDLPHTWGSTNDPGLPENCQTDDGVADTPNTIGWTECVANPISCGTLSNIDNYMEYAYCSKMFTLGQAARMVAALNSPVAERSNLWQAQNLEATGVNDSAQACTAAFTSDTRLICAGETVHFQDFSYSGIVERTWIFEGGQPTVSQAQNPNVVYNSPGLYAVTLAASDGVNQVSTVQTEYIRVLDTAYTPIPFVESFESSPPLNSTLNALWFTENQSGEVDWEITDLAAYSGDKSVYVHGLYNPSGSSEYLISQTFDLTSLDSTGTLSLTFKYACAKRSNASQDRLRVWISKNCGGSWNLRNDISGDELYTVPQSVNGEFIPTQQAEWLEATVFAIPPSYNTSSFRIRFQFLSQSGNNIFIDDINLQATESVSVSEMPTNLKNSIRLYPNPATDQIKIEIRDFKSTSALSITLHDITGRKIKKVYSNSVSGGDFILPLDVSGLSNGMYILRFMSTDGSFSKKFIVGN